MTNARITLSVVVTVVGGHAFLRRCLRHLTAQVGGSPIEVIVPYDATVEGMPPLKEEYPHVTFMDLGVVETTTRAGTPAAAHELYDRCRARGLGAARGAVIAMIEDYAIPAPDWCDQVLAAHELPYGVIGGAVEHAASASLNWAVYLLDFGRYQLPLPEGPAEYLTDVNVSYKRAALESVKHLWAARYHEVTIHWALVRQGDTLWRRPQIVVGHDRGTLHFFPLLKARLAWGRLFAMLRVRELSLRARFTYLVLSPVIPLILLGRVARKAWRDGRHRGPFLRALPAMTALSCSWCLGELAAYLTGREGSTCAATAPKLVSAASTPCGARVG